MFSLIVYFVKTFEASKRANEMQWPFYELFIVFLNPSGKREGKLVCRVACGCGGRVVGSLPVCSGNSMYCQYTGSFQ